MRGLRIITAAVLIAGVVYVSSGFWAPEPAKFLIRTDPLDSADLIVVLVGDGSGSRVDEGLRLLDPDSWRRSRPGREIVVIEWIKTLNSWMEQPD